jgi:hypothetical protein
MWSGLSNQISRAGLIQNESDIAVAAPACGEDVSKEHPISVTVD